MSINITIEPQEYHFNHDTPFETIKNYISENGFAVITNVLSTEEVNNAKEMFFEWKNSIPDFDMVHNKIDPHGIYKHHVKLVIKNMLGLLEQDLKFKNNFVNYGILMN